MISLLYELVVLAGFLLLLPKALYQAIRYKKYRTSWLAKFGWRFPHVTRKGSGPIIWLHAVSVGETTAISRFAKLLKEEIKDATLIVSSGTETGHAEAKRLMPFAEYTVYLPFDFFLTTKLALSRAKPDILILCEADFWYRFLKETKKQGAICLLVNGKISDKSAKHFAKVLPFTRRLFSLIDTFCVQSEAFKKSFRSLGVPASKLVVTGNMKSDIVTTPLDTASLVEMRRKLYLQPEDLVLVIGSTHAPEEEQLLEQLTPLLQQFSNLKIILAARHPERFAEVISLVQKHNLPYGTWTKGASSLDPRLFLIDAMGVLRHCYQLADIAIVAGSFTEKVGGHNILEAQAFGVPVVIGPYMHSQADLLKQSKAYDAVVQVTMDQVQDTIRDLLQSKEKREELRKNSLTMCAAIQGATEKNIEALRFLAPQYFLQQKSV